MLAYVRVSYTTQDESKQLETIERWEKRYGIKVTDVIRLRISTKTAPERREGVGVYLFVLFFTQREKWPNGLRQ